MYFSPIVQSLLAGLFTWSVTALGAGAVFILKGKEKNMLNFFMGLGAGIMTSAAFWSLLSPAVEIAAQIYSSAFILPVLGLLLGSGFTLATDIFTHRVFDKKRARSLLLVGAITAHNLPEGMVLGVAFACAAKGMGTVEAAILLTVAIGLQNFPEGASVSLPLFSEGYSKGRSFFYGQLSAAIEPIGALIGAAAVFAARALLPLLLAFAAGAMLTVVNTELMPGAVAKNRSLSVISFTLGFCIMTILDIAIK